MVLPESSSLSFHHFKIEALCVCVCVCVCSLMARERWVWAKRFLIQINAWIMSPWGITYLDKGTRGCPENSNHSPKACGCCWWCLCIQDGWDNETSVGSWPAVFVICREITILGCLTHNINILLVWIWRHCHLNRHGGGDREKHHWSILSIYEKLIFDGWVSCCL